MNFILPFSVDTVPLRTPPFWPGIGLYSDYAGCNRRSGSPLIFSFVLLSRLSHLVDTMILVSC